MIVLHDLSLYLYDNAFRRSRTCGNFLEEWDPIRQLIQRRLWLGEQYFMVHYLFVWLYRNSTKKEEYKLSELRTLFEVHL
jgi:hypothetical protein